MQLKLTKDPAKMMKVKRVVLYTKGSIIDVSGERSEVIHVKERKAKSVNREIDSYWPNKFALAITQAFEFYKIPIPRQGKWRLCDYRLGSIAGFPNTFGRVFATDGIMCFIYQGDHKFAMGHYEYFVEDVDPLDVERKERGPYKKKEINIDFLI